MVVQVGTPGLTISAGKEGTPPPINPNFKAVVSTVQETAPVVEKFGRLELQTV